MFCEDPEQIRIVEQLCSLNPEYEEYKDEPIKYEKGEDGKDIEYKEIKYCKTKSDYKDDAYKIPLSFGNVYKNDFSKRQLLLKSFSNFNSILNYRIC